MALIKGDTRSLDYSSYGLGDVDHSQMASNQALKM